MSTVYLIAVGLVIICSCHESTSNDSDDVVTFKANNTGCLRSQFRCADGKACVTEYSVCDSSADCDDGSDEEGCESRHCPFRVTDSLTIERDHHRCGGGKCVPDLLVCDGVPDCDDSSDEEDCDPSDVSGCLSKEFPCSDGERCIPTSNRCDGIPDCADGSDESGCDAHRCGRHHRCGGGRCVPNLFVCDGVQDCRDDASDEEGCETQWTRVLLQCVPEGDDACARVKGPNHEEVDRRTTDLDSFRSLIRARSRPLSISGGGSL